jgi:hypothetical protein
MEMEEDKCNQRVVCQTCGSIWEMLVQGEDAINIRLVMCPICADDIRGTSV